MDAVAPFRRRGVVGAVVIVVFVVCWCVAGVRGIVVDDSRWVWGMFPYVLEVKVARVDYIDDAGRVLGAWKLPKRGRPLPSLQPGRLDDHGYGYGKGAWDSLIVRLGQHAWQTAPAGTAIVEVEHTTRRSERAPSQRLFAWRGHEHAVVGVAAAAAVRGGDVDVDVFGRLRALIGFVAVCKFVGLTSPIPRLVHGKLELGLPLHRYHPATFPPVLGPSVSWLPTTTFETYDLVETVGLVVAVLMMSGVLSRLSSLAVFLTCLWLLLVDASGFKHNLWAMAMFAGLLSLSPCGAAHSIDALVRRRLLKRWPPPTTTWILPLRLVQLQIAVIYMFSTLRKLNDGWATGHLLRHTVEKMPEQLAAAGLSALTPLLTWPGWYVVGAWLTVGLEGFLAVGFFSRRWRPWRSPSASSCTCGSTSPSTSGRTPS